MALSLGVVPVPGGNTGMRIPRNRNQTFLKSSLCPSVIYNDGVAVDALREVSCLSREASIFGGREVASYRWLILGYID